MVEGEFRDAGGNVKQRKRVERGGGYVKQRKRVERGGMEGGGDCNFGDSANHSVCSNTSRL